MRVSVLPVLLVGLSCQLAGCTHFRRCAPMDNRDCNAAQTENPGACAPEAARVEIHQPPPIHIKVPQQQVIVSAPPAQPVPAMQAAPMAQPMALTAAQGYTQQSFTPLTTVGTVESVPMGRARLGFTFDFFRIPIPYPRLIAVPTTQEIRVPFSQPQLVAAAPQMVAQPAMVAAQPQMVAQPMAYAAAPPPVPAQAMVPVQGQAVVPVQGQAIVPVQGQAIVPVQGQAAVPVAGQTAVPSQGQVFIASPAAATAATPQMALQLSPQAVKTLSPQEVEEFCRQVQALKAAMEARDTATSPCPKK